MELRKEKEVVKKPSLFMRFLKVVLYLFGGLCLSGLVLVGSLYLWGSSDNTNSVTTETAEPIKQEDSRAVSDKATSDLEVNLARARGYLSEGTKVSDTSTIKTYRDKVESLFSNYRSNKSDSRLKEDSSGISLRYAIERQGYVLNSDLFEVWSTKDSDVVNLVVVLTGGKNDDMYIVLSYENSSDAFHILYLYGGKPDTFG